MKLQLALKQGQIAAVELVSKTEQLPKPNRALQLYFEHYRYECNEILTGECVWLYFADEYFMKCEYEIDVVIKTDRLEHPDGMGMDERYSEVEDFHWIRTTLYKDDEIVWTGLCDIPKEVRWEVEEEEMQEAIDNI